VPLTYNPDAPVDLQPDDWSCSEQSAQWLLRSIGRKPGDAWIRDQLLTNGLVTPELGLMDASGVQLARWLQKEYGDEMGLVVKAVAPVLWEDILTMAGTRPVMIGGRGWNHWSGVRRARGNVLELANPAPNWKGVGTELDMNEWAAQGPWSAIAVYTPEELETSAPPKPELEPWADPIKRVRALLMEALGVLTIHYPDNPTS
jgi:hypothetical protein